MIRIKFKTDADEARGFYELLTRASGESLQGGIYWVEESALKILDESGIGYEILPKELLKKRFEQEEIWITAMTIELI
jgi:hypothetical protein